MKHELSETLRRYYVWVLDDNQCEYDMDGERIKKLRAEVKELETRMSDKIDELDVLREGLRSIFGIELVKDENGHWVLP